MLLLIFVSAAAAPPDPDPPAVEEDENLGSGGQKPQKSGKGPKDRRDKDIPALVIKNNRARMQFQGPQSLPAMAQAVIALIASGALEEY